MGKLINAGPLEMAVRTRSAPLGRLEGWGGPSDRGLGRARSHKQERAR